MRTVLVFVVAAAAVSLPALAVTTPEPTVDGLAIRDKAYRDRIVYIVLNGGDSHAAKAPLKITARTLTFTDAADGQLYSLQTRDVDMPATLELNNELIPQGRWVDEATYRLKDLELRALSPEEMDQMRLQIGADLAAAKEAYREAYTGAACGGSRGIAAQLCAMNASATADRRIKVIEAKAKTQF